MTQKELYQLMDDMHTALAKSSLPSEEYNILSFRIIEAKHGLLTQVMEQANGTNTNTPFMMVGEAIGRELGHINDEKK